MNYKFLMALCSVLVAPGCVWNKKDEKDHKHNPHKTGEHGVRHHKAEVETQHLRDDEGRHHHHVGGHHKKHKLEVTTEGHRKHGEEGKEHKKHNAHKTNPEHKHHGKMHHHGEEVETQDMRRDERERDRDRRRMERGHGVEVQAVDERREHREREREHRRGGVATQAADGDEKRGMRGRMQERRHKRQHGKGEGEMMTTEMYEDDSMDDDGDWEN